MKESQPGDPLVGNEEIFRSSGLVEHFMYFLGQFTVREEGDFYIVEDFYDFNQINVNPEHYEKIANAWTDLSTSVSHVMEKLSIRSVYDLVRRMATWRHSTGYKGFPVEIKISKSLAPTTKP
jgi:hypothetical protein